MNKSQKKEVRKINESISRFSENRYKTRGGRAETIHSSSLVREKNISVLSGRKVDPEDYIDIE